MLNDEFKTQIETFIHRVGITPTTFGRMALSDPNFISQLRKGRVCSLRTAEKICVFMECTRSAHNPGANRPGRTPS